MWHERTLRRAQVFLAFIGLFTFEIQVRGQTPAALSGPIVNPSNGHDYYLLAPASWHDSEAAAMQMGGHLVAITTDQENLWVKDTFSMFQGTERDLWIGLRNLHPWTEGSDPNQWGNEFEWSSQQAGSLRLWASNEMAPTNTLRSGFCKMLVVNAASTFEKGRWIEERPEALLSGVVKIATHLEILSSPQDVTTAPDGEVELKVIADGPQPIYYQWELNGAIVPGATAASLILTNLTAAQAGVYRVIVTNADTVLVSAPASVRFSSLLIWGCYYHGETNVPANAGTLVGISAGDQFTLGLRTDHTVVAWGTAYYGQLDVPWGLSDVVAVAAGGQHSVALKADGTVVCWGNGNFGGTSVPPGLTNVAAIAAGSSHTFALRRDGTVVSWGLNTGGQPPYEITNAVAIASGWWHDVVLTSKGEVVGWNYSSGGEKFGTVPPGLRNIVAVSAGGTHSVALRADGKVIAWGDNTFGQTNVPAGLSNVVAIAAGYNHTLALTADGSVVAWGVNPQGLSLAPPPVPNAHTIAAGTEHDLMLVGDGTPRIKVEPWDRAAEPGSAVSIFAKVVGTPPLSFQWTFNGNEIPSATNDAYTIPSCDLINSGVYALWVTNAHGVQASRSAMLTVRPAGIVVSNQPPILPNLNDLSVEQFSDLVVTNTAVDPDGPAGAIQYPFLVAPAGMGIDRSGIIRWTPGSGQAPGTNLVMTVATDAGSPPLSATNSFTVIVSPWTESTPTVLAGPILNPATGHRYLLLDRATWTNAELAAVSLGGHLVTVNDPQENNWLLATFGNFGGVSRDLWLGLYAPDECSALSNPFRRLAEYRWTSGQPFTTSPFSWAAGGPFNLGHLSLGFFKLCGPANPLCSGQGFWADESPEIPHASVVELPADLEIILSPQSLSIGIGCDATLQVFADGSTPVSYQWQRAGTNLPGQTHATLIFTNAQFDQSGSYAVSVSNGSGTLQSPPAEMSVAAIVTWGSFPTGDDTRTNVPPGLTNVLAVAAGYYHDLALKADGTVVGWGQNGAGQTDVPPGLSNVTAIAAGAGHSLALRSDGAVIAWGSTTRVPGDLTNVVAIDAGANNSLALKSDGTVVAWGESFNGPSISPPGLSNVVAISAGAGHDLALLDSGLVVDWNDSTGGLNATPSDLTNAVAISAAQLSALALRADGTAVGWGTAIDFGGSLNVPADLTNAVGICLKWDHSLAMAADGTMVAAWGTNWAGESSVPARLPNVVAIAGGYYHSIALLRDGAPNLTVQPWDRVVPQGSSAILSAKAVSRDDMSYQWQVNGQDIAGATNDLLEIRDVQPLHAGTYTLSASNAVGFAVSRHAKLTVFTTAPFESPILQVLPVHDGVFRLRVVGSPGRRYMLEISTTAETWSPIRTNIPTVMPFEIAEPIQPGPAHRWYRVRVTP